LSVSGRLAGKVAIVTGAGSSGPGLGTGKAMSVLFAREGARVVLVDMIRDRAQETLGIIEEEGGDATIVTADLSDLSQAQRIVDEAVGCYGGVDILVNNAAISSSTNLLDTTIDLLQTILTVNLAAPFMLIKAVVPVMQRGGGGSIVNISSIAALRGQGGQGQTAYASAKAGLEGLMYDVADAFGKDGIRINCIAPGIIDTPMRNNAITQAGLDPAQLDLSFKISLPREGDAWDIAQTALFLVSADGHYITGVMIPVDGGTVARSH
jgi:NAD(P)-dependent dehydrogenase (short-subunit alcohol dehydrogenase family)